MGHHTVAVLTEDGILLDVAKGIVHPTHVPFVREAQAVCVKGGDVGPHGRLLCDGEHVGVILCQAMVEMLEEGDRLQVPAIPVLVGMPAAALSVIVEVQHRRHSVHTETVGVEFLHPIVGVGDEEGLDLPSAHVKAIRTPTLVLLSRGILVLVQRLSVKVVQPVGVLGEMGGYPIKDHADACGVERVHKRLEILGRAVSRGGGVVAAHLIAP